MCKCAPSWLHACVNGTECRDDIFAIVHLTDPRLFFGCIYVYVCVHACVRLHVCVHLVVAHACILPCAANSACRRTRAISPPSATSHFPKVPLPSTLTG